MINLRELSIFLKNSEDCQDWYVTALKYPLSRQEWVAIPFSRGSSQPRNRTQVFHIAGRFFTSWATREAHCVDHNKLWKILKEMGIPDHFTCFLRNLYAGQEATGHGTTDWFQIGKGVRQGCILSPCLFNFYAEYVMTNTGLEEAQAGIKIVRRNINNLR